MFCRSAKPPPRPPPPPGHAKIHTAARTDSVLLSSVVIQETLEGLQSAEPMAEKLKGQLNDLVRYSRDLGSPSERVTALIKQHNR